MEGSGFSLDVKGKGSLINGLVEGSAILARGTDRIPLTITGRWRAPVVAREAPPDVAGEQSIIPDEAGSATGG
jgi:hypothetical protein